MPALVQPQPSVLRSVEKHWRVYRLRLPHDYELHPTSYPKFEVPARNGTVPCSASFLARAFSNLFESPYDDVAIFFS